MAGVPDVAVSPRLNVRHTPAETMSTDIKRHSLSAGGLINKLDCWKAQLVVPSHRVYAQQGGYSDCMHQFPMRHSGYMHHLVTWL
jgi:hypothetical protein